MQSLLFTSCCQVQVACASVNCSCVEIRNKKEKHESSILQPHGFLFERVNCAAKRLWKITMLKTTKELSHDQSI